MDSILTWRGNTNRIGCLNKLTVDRLIDVRETAALLSQTIRCGQAQRQFVSDMGTGWRLGRNQVLPLAVGCPSIFCGEAGNGMK